MNSFTDLDVWKKAKVLRNNVTILNQQIISRRKKNTG